ncbi:hypothetical protein A2Y99_01480 [Candidatus Gottesmanbacteria bacterium RBG_13_37_7]|uniref:Uncharacterized protein n=1 Tax=Candidatus Gottesmanbacteria bacterium RBG_13_37_7 TaxID=1798369 RepID=A0A1F5YIF5_9BACT|nr:MAG: hypothetical protein A2Y99_01480 [Candidatus Gottesmanbacteria bacterium RBG_13_37_7]
MIEYIHEPISVQLVFKSKTRSAYPTLLVWRERLYKVKKIGFHHFYRTGKALFHVFSVTDGKLFFKLCFNTENLHWTLEEIADGEAN